MKIEVACSIREKVYVSTENGIIKVGVIGFGQFNFSVATLTPELAATLAMALIAAAKEHRSS